jgi:hypothetical protein
MAKPFLKWIIVGLAVLAVLGYIWFLRGENKTLSDDLAAAKTALAYSKADTDRYVDAVGARDKTIASLNEQLQKVAADAQDSRDAALAQAHIDQATILRTSQTNEALRRNANAAKPQDQPKPLSPYAHLSAEWLRCRTEAGSEAVAAACADKAGLPTN